MKKKPIKLFVFDMAGTTVDEDNVVYKTLQSAINAQGFSFDLDTVLAEGAGKEKFQAIKDVLAIELAQEDELESQAKKAFALFRESLDKAYAKLEVGTFPGTLELFDWLRQRGVKVALNTGYDRPTAQSLLGKLNWEQGKDYDLLITADEVANSRPAPDMIQLAMDRLGVSDPSAVAKVGDSAIDIEEGKAAGCGLTLGVTTGAQTEAQLRTAKPDSILHALPEIKKFLSADDYVNTGSTPAPG